MVVNFDVDGCMMNVLRGPAAPFFLIGAVLGGAACSSDNCEDTFGGVGCTLNGEIVTPDTTIFKGETISYQAAAIYGIGPGQPASIRWGSSDTGKVAVFPRTDLTASVTAKDSGSVYIFALINETFLDSAELTIVIRGAARWRATFAEPIGLQGAADDSTVRIVTGGAAPQLRVYATDGTARSPVTSCFSALGPSISLDAATYATADGCTRRHGDAGIVAWTAPAGNANLGVALATDGAVVTVSQDSVFRVSSTGSVLWGRALRGTPVTAPVISGEGDITIGWQAGGADSVSRFTSTGTPRWSVAVSGLSPGTPALSGTRFIFPRPGGLFALDSSGVVPWDLDFSAELAGASASGATSSPVIDDANIVFIQNEDGLFSYTTGGTFLWVADSLGYGAATGPVGAPALLVDGTLLVPCQTAAGREVCSVEQATGALEFRTSLGGGDARGITVGALGMIFVTRDLTAGGTEVVALWGRVAAEPNGWPAAGGDHQRTRNR